MRAADIIQKLFIIKRARIIVVRNFTISIKFERLTNIHNSVISSYEMSNVIENEMTNFEGLEKILTMYF